MGGNKKHKKKHKKEKKRSKRKSSSSENSSEEEVWVEKESKDGPEKAPETDDWLDNADQLFATITRDKPKSKEKNKPERPSIDEMGQSSQELNPYWKDGGSGVPRNAAVPRNKAIGTVGDLGLGWLRKALQRAKQTAIEENRPLEDVVAPVWGSLDKLLNMIKEAEDKLNDKPDNSRGYSSGSSRYDRYRQDRFRDQDHRGFRRPDPDNQRNRNDQTWRNEDRSRSFRKPSDIGENNPERQDDGRHDRRKANYSGSSDRLNRLRNSYRDSQKSSWKKPSETTSSGSSPRHDSLVRREHSPSHSDPEEGIKKESSPHAEPKVEEPSEKITEGEINQMAEDIIQAQKSGNEDKVKELKEKLKKAQTLLDRGSKPKRYEQKEVILTQTDRRGFTQPFQSSSSSHPTSRRRKKFETHEDGKRMRYFADDDKYSLQDLIQQEKFVSVSDQNEMYTKLAKGAGQKSDDDDFEEGGGREKSEEWTEFSRRQKVARQSIKHEKALESCKFCLDSQAANKRLVVSLMDKAYLCVPPFQSLTDGHCLIMPIQHASCSTLLDEDVWEEVMDLRKLVVNLFQEEDKDVIFYESAKNLNKFPHMILNCVPVSKEIGDEAPIYFKKALLECETDWSNNKKVVDLKGRDVRKAVPKGLPYFAVDFGLQSGFAHVIEDERYFPRNFAEEIIGGMMDMHHSIWRKRKRDELHVQIVKAQEFIRKFKEFMSKKQF